MSEVIDHTKYPRCGVCRSIGNQLSSDSPAQLKSTVFTDEELEKKCQENRWVKHWGIMFAEDPFAEDDYTYCFTECGSIEELEHYFLHGNWAIRQGFLYRTLAFINQINAGDEWWTLKKFPDGEILAFESMTMIRIIERNCDRCGLPRELLRKDTVFCKKCLDRDYGFEQLIKGLLAATKTQCRKLEYGQAVEDIATICNECGRSVAGGSGLFVNRVHDFNDYKTRKESGHRFPEGDYICRECDAAEYWCEKCGLPIEKGEEVRLKDDTILCGRTECDAEHRCERCGLPIDEETRLDDTTMCKGCEAGSINHGLLKKSPEPK